MADFKHEEQGPVWSARGCFELKCILTVLDALRLLFYGREMMVTDAIREPREGHPSFHPVGQALDLRSKDLPELMRRTVRYTVKFINMLWVDVFKRDGKFDLVLEDNGGDNEHFHLEYDNGEPV